MGDRQGGRLEGPRLQEEAGRRVWEVDVGAYLLVGAPLVLLLTKAGQLILDHTHDKTSHVSHLLA